MTCVLPALSFTIYLEIVLSIKSTNQKHGGFDVTVSLFSWGHPTELYYISGDCALIPRQSTNCNQKHGGFWPNLRHFDVTVSLFSCRTPLTRYLSSKNLSTSRGQWMAP